jgi:hypothetical protein
MKLLDWSNDPETLAFIESHERKNNFIFHQPEAQYPGQKTFDKQKLYTDIRDTSWLDKVDTPSPENIINAFKSNKLLEGLALVKLWGGMARTRKYIYSKNLETIEKTLQGAQKSIIDSNNITLAWNLLQNELNWSIVMTSKTLHFLARSLDYEENPPVPLDRYAILKHVWPTLTKSYDKRDRPQPWHIGLDGYKRYMTFINYFANESGWNNTQYEATLFNIAPTFK